MGMYFMIIVIDCYNLLKTILHVQFIKKLDRIKYLSLFEEYALLRGHDLIVDFDGVEDDEFDQKYDRVTIYYSGPFQTADYLITKKLQALRGGDLLLVTSDRELRQHAKKLDIESIGSVDFYELMKNVMKQKEQSVAIIAQTIHKTCQQDDPYLDSLMEKSSRILVQKEQDKKNINFKLYNDKKYCAKKDKKLLKKIVKI